MTLNSRRKKRYVPTTEWKQIIRNINMLPCRIIYSLQLTSNVQTNSHLPLIISRDNIDNWITDNQVIRYVKQLLQFGIPCILLQMISLLDIYCLVSLPLFQLFLYFFFFLFNSTWPVDNCIHSSSFFLASAIPIIFPFIDSISRSNISNQFPLHKLISLEIKINWDNLHNLT